MFKKEKTASEEVKKEFVIDEVFPLDETYDARVEFCDANNCYIEEITTIDDKERKFVIRQNRPSTRFNCLFDEITEKKELLKKYREDVEQVDLFHLKRADVEEKRKLCAQLVLELRGLENQLELLQEEDRNI